MRARCRPARSGSSPTARRHDATAVTRVPHERGHLLIGEYPDAAGLGQGAGSAGPGSARTSTPRRIPISAPVSFAGSGRAGRPGRAPTMTSVTLQPYRKRRCRSCQAHRLLSTFSGSRRQPEVKIGARPSGCLGIERSIYNTQSTPGGSARIDDCIRAARPARLARRAPGDPGRMPSAASAAATPVTTRPSPRSCAPPPVALIRTQAGAVSRPPGTVRPVPAAGLALTYTAGWVRAGGSHAAGHRGAAGGQLDAVVRDVHHAGFQARVKPAAGLAVGVGDAVRHDAKILAVADRGPVVCLVKLAGHSLVPRNGWERHARSSTRQRNCSR